MEFIINYYYVLFNILVKNKHRFTATELSYVHSHIIVACLTSFVMVAYTIFSYISIANRFVFYMGVVCTLVHFCTIFLYRISNKVYAFSFLMLFAGGVYETVFAYYTGGVSSNILTWYGVMPIFGGIVLGRSGAFIWSIIVTSLTLFFIALEIFGKTPVSLFSPEMLIASHALLLFCFIFLSSASVLIYIIFKDKSDLDLITQKNKYKKLVSVLLHDISGPVTICKNYLGQIHPFNDEAHPSNKAFERIRNSVYSIGEIVDSVKQMHKYQDGRVQMQLETVRFKDCVLESLTHLKDILVRKNIQIQFEYEGCDDSLIKVDRLLLEKQILANVFSNSLKFSGDNQIIYLKISRVPNQTLRLRIIDKGVGIPQNVLIDLFLESNLNNPFTKDGEITTGHSLMMAKEFLDLFDGAIKIDSISKISDIQNHGTIVDIYLPDYSAR